MSNIVRSLLVACLLAAGPVGLGSALAASRASHHGATSEADVSSAQSAPYSWSPELSPSGPVEIVVSLAEQRAYVYRGGVEIGESEVSTGMEGRETPTGVFPILEKQTFHRSNKYDDAPMPFMQRLTWYGVALHGGRLPGYAASHGCIRLPLAFARKLFGITSVGTKVVVTDGLAEPPTVDAPQSVAAADQSGTDADYDGGGAESEVP
jgi:lipoprotein-anchoring transpeptidase ErfK/SrfK